MQRVFVRGQGPLMGDPDHGQVPGNEGTEIREPLVKQVDQGA
jgi:hypothetical protein